MERNNQFTFGSYEWFTGVVVDIKDPKQYGRVKVRINGYHTQDTNELPDDHLPWAIVASPTSSAATSGIGNTPHGLIKGSHVIGFFADGKSSQQPIITHTFPGITNGQPDIDTLARGGVIKKTLDDAGTWKEPSSGAAPSYPNNKVIRTTSGHVIEIDDTPGKERLHVFHKSGTFTEFHPDGTLVNSVKGSDYKVVQKDLNVHVIGNANINVDGNVVETIKGDKTSNITGAYKITCKSYSITTATSWTAKVGSSGYMKCGGTSTFKASMIYLN
jgi:hypothetical protein